MEKNLALISFQICLGLLLAISVRSEANNPSEYCCRAKETKITVYVQLITAGPNANAAAVAGIPGRPRNGDEFGSTYVADSPLTRGISMNSPTVGRGQGILVTSSLDGSSRHELFSFIFTNGQYNGSTLEFQGREIQDGSVPVRELSVVSGTKMFRYVHGYATVQTVLDRPEKNYMVIRFDITIRQY